MTEVPWIGGPPRRALQDRGAALLRLEGAADLAAASPWAFAERLFGERVLLVEQQPIRPVPRGRTFASSGAFTPMHTDSQRCLGVPAGVQVLACRRPASRGGESTLVDGWDLVATARDEDADLYARMFDETRALRFTFGDFTGPTVSLRQGHLFFTHAPAPAPEDATAARVQSLVDRAPRMVVRLGAGDVLLVNNHRMLHGRLAFDDPSRDMVRLLVWLEVPWSAPREIASRARVEPESSSPLPSRRLAVVLEMLRGVAPGVLAAREGVAEEDLYRWRDVALLAAGRALE
jgi:hypothetical protein